MLSILTIVVDGRPQVSGAISGPTLGAAAHRLVKSSLQNNFSGNGRSFDMSDRSYSYMVAKPRPAGPLGYERGFQETNSYYNYSGPNPRAPSNSRPVHLFSENQSSRHNFRTERMNPQDLSYNLQTGMSSLAIEEGANYRSHPRTQSAGFYTNHQQPRLVSSQQQQLQSPGPPPSLPPTNWIDRQPSIGYAGGFSKQYISSRVIYDKQPQQIQQQQVQQQQPVYKVYRVKSQVPESPSDIGRQQ